MRKKGLILIVFVLSASLLLAACQPVDANGLKATGYLTAREVKVAPELAGKVIEVLVSEGDEVQAGTVLLRLDDEVLLAQKAQAQAAVDSAKAALAAAETQVGYARSQRDLALQGARLQDMQSRLGAWATPMPDDYRPAWYFQKSEQLAAAHKALSNARVEVDEKTEALDKVLKDSSNRNFVDIEKRLIDAQTAWDHAKAALKKAETARDEDLTKAAEDAADLAESNFDLALKAYDGSLNDRDAQAVNKARAELAVARATADSAQDHLSSLEVGDDSTQVEVALAGLEQAQAAVEQAKAGQAQAEAALSLLELQLARAELKAPIAGTVMNLAVRQGELTAAGAPLVSLAPLTDLELVVYLPEDRYGKVQLGDSVDIRVDSYSGETFKSTVLKIADSAQFTPRNVQTVEGRGSSVYAVTLAVSNPSLKLKPGMPADVDFRK